MNSFKSYILCFTGIMLMATTGFVTTAQADDLLEIYELASENDAQIRRVREQYLAEQTLVSQQRSRLLPSVTLNGRTARNAQAPEQEFSYAQGFNSHGYSINLNQSLLNAEAWYAFQSAQQAGLQAMTSLAMAEQELILRVVSAYLDVLRSQDNLASFQAEEEAARLTLERSNGMFEAGLAAGPDVEQSQANYDLTRVNRLLEESTLDQRLQALQMLTGYPHQGLESLGQEFPIENAEPDNVEAWLAIADDNNLDIKAAEYAFEASQLNTRSVRASRLPTFSLGANFTDNAESANPFSFFPNTASNSSSISLNLNIPLYSGGLNSARMRQALHNQNAEEEALILAQRNSVHQSRNNFRRVQTAVLTISAREQAVASAESAVESIQAGFEVGTRSIVELVLAQRTLFQAQRDLANARYDYILDTLRLKQAAGILTPQDVIDLNEWLE